MHGSHRSIQTVYALLCYGEIPSHFAHIYHRTLLALGAIMTSIIDSVVVEHTRNIRVNKWNRSTTKSQLYHTVEGLVNYWLMKWFYRRFRQRKAIYDINQILYGYVQYLPRNVHTDFALLCFVVVIHWLIFPYPSGLLHWYCGNLTIAPVPAKQPWWIWINTSCECIMSDCKTTTKQSTTKPCAYFLEYTVLDLLWKYIIQTDHNFA